MRSFATSDFLPFLSNLTQRRASGVIVVERAGVETRFELREGLAAAVEGGAIAETLGRLLVDEGALGRASYAAVLAQITDAESRLERKRFGEAAIECGFLTADQLEDALRAQLRLKLARCIEQDKIRARFDDGSILEPGPRYAITLASCVLGALWRFDDPRLAGLLAPIRGRKLVLTQPPASVVESLALWDDEKPVIEALAKRRVEDILDDTQCDAAPILGALLLSNFVRPEGDDDGKRAKALRPRPTKRRWTHLPSSRVSMKSFGEEEPPSRIRAEAILRRMSSERDDRRGTFANAPRSLAEVRLIAEAAFQLGLGHLGANTLDRAYAEFARAADLVPSAAEYVLYARYTDFAARQARSTGFDPAQRAARAAALEVAADSALAQMPHLAFAHYVRGQIAMLEGRDGDAIASFRRAVRLDFDLVDAERQIRLLELKRRRSGASLSEPPEPAEIISAESIPPAAAVPTIEELVAAAPEPEKAPEREPSIPPAPPAPPAVTTQAAVVSSTAESDPAYALPTSSQAPPPKRGWLPWALAAVVLLAAGAGGASLYLSHTGPTRAALPPATTTAVTSTTASASAVVTPSASVAATASVTASASAIASATATASAPASAAVTASAAPSATASSAATTASVTPPSSNEGTIVAPAAAAKGHRVLVDGRSVGDAPGPFTVRCGAHTIQLGSHGKEQKLTVPCGGELTVEP